MYYRISKWTVISSVNSVQSIYRYKRHLKRQICDSTENTWKYKIDRTCKLRVFLRKWITVVKWVSVPQTLLVQHRMSLLKTPFSKSHKRHHRKSVHIHVTSPALFIMPKSMPNDQSALLASCSVTQSNVIH